MLHSISHKKTTLYRRYLGHRDHEDKRVAEEDEITGMLLGPLAFLPPECRAIFWYGMLVELNAPDIRTDIPKSAEMKFWPRINGIEPDLMICLEWSDGYKVPVIVELKWRAPLSGENQLHEQWNKCFVEKEKMQKKGYHIFIAPEVSAALIAKKSHDVWQGRLLPIAWNVIKRMFESNSFKSHNKEFFLWGDLVTRTLEKIGVRSFKGFNSLEQYPSFTGDCDYLFWRGMQGFGVLGLPQNISVPQLVFFYEEECNDAN